MPEYGCIDLTLDSDQEREKSRRDREKKRQRPASPDSDIILVDDEEQQQDQQQKRAKGEAQQQQQQQNGTDDEDVVLESATGPVAIRDFAHGRPQCGNYAFKQGTNKDNSKWCDQCYCFVCDVKAEECQYWGEGGRARDHCNAHACHYWNSLRRQARKGASSAALLQAEFNNSSSTLSTNWTLPVGGSSSSGGAGMKRGRHSMPAAGSMPSLATMWARKAAEKTPAPAAAAATPAPAAAAARAPALAAAAAAGRTPAAAGAAGAAAAAGRTPAAAAAAAAGAPSATPASAAAAAAAAAGGSMATPATAPGRLGVPATAIKQDPGAQKQQKQQKQQAVLKVFPAASPWLKQIPHPKDAKVPTQVDLKPQKAFLKEIIQEWVDALEVDADAGDAAAAGATAAAAAAAGNEAAAAAAAAAGNEAAAAAAAGGDDEAGGDAFSGMPGSQEVRTIAQEAGLQSSQAEMTPYLLAQLEQQRLALQFMERWEQQQKQQ